MLSGKELHLVQMGNGAAPVLYLYSCNKGQWPQRSWARTVRLSLGSVFSGLCISGGRAFRMWLWGLFVRYRPVGVVWMCLMGLVLTWGRVGQKSEF